jgi:hypothetical protein
LKPTIVRSQKLLCILDHACRILVAIAESVARQLKRDSSFHTRKTDLAKLKRRLTMIVRI